MNAAAATNPAAVQRRPLDTRITTDLQVGDIVHIHGSRMRLAVATIDAAAAAARWPQTVECGYLERDAESGDPTAVAALSRRREQALNLRAFSAEYVGPVRDAQHESIPDTLRDGWTVQGNHLAAWAVEPRA